MKTLKLFSFLGLVILLIGFNINCKDKNVNPYNPIPPDPPDPSIIEVTVEYTNNGSITAKASYWEITLISTDVKQELQDIFVENRIHKAKGKFLIIEFTAKNLSGSFHLIGDKMFSIHQDNNVFTKYPGTTVCFLNGFSFIGLPANWEFPEPQILVFDVANLNNLTLVFNNLATTNPTIKIFFKLLNL